MTRTERIIVRLIAAFLAVFALLFGMASLLGHPGPFVVWGFSFGVALCWLSARVWWRIWPALGGLIAGFPTSLLWSYGSDDGGVSGAAGVILAFATMFAAATLLALGGRALGRSEG
jgi:hypothetical protein